MKEELKKQNFRSEAEEAKWWEEHQDDLANEFEGAAALGAIGHGTAARKGKTPTTTIRLDPADIAVARAQAATHGLRYQTYLKVLIREALRAREQYRSEHEGLKMKGKERLFVEQRPQGDYAVRKPKSDRASAVSRTQAEAIERARELNPGTSPLVERVRNTSSGSPDKWRKP
ncbi:MAG: DUF2188 domain-containing protein [Acidobacteriota bacterium]